MQTGPQIRTLGKRKHVFLDSKKACIQPLPDGLPAIAKSEGLQNNLAFYMQFSLYSDHVSGFLAYFEKSPLSRQELIVELREKKQRWLQTFMTHEPTFPSIPMSPLHFMLGVLICVLNHLRMVDMRDGPFWFGIIHQNSNRFKMIIAILPFIHAFRWLNK